MKTAAVMIDDWKLVIFKKRLGEAGYTYTEHLGLTESTILLRVSYDWVANLQPIIEAANAECAQLKGMK